MKGRYCSAFTLVELLVVIAVIAVLASLLFSVSRGLIAKGDGAQCLNNLRRLGTAGALYANDHAGLLPDRTAWPSVTAANKRLSLVPYLDIEVGLPNDRYLYDTVFTCKAAQRARRTSAVLHRTYAINQWASGSSISEIDSFNKTVLAMSGPLKMQNTRPNLQAFMMDGPSVEDTAGARYSVYQRPDRINHRTSSNWYTTYVHDGGLHVVFLDGHVERITKEYADAELIGNTNGEPSPRTHPFWGAGK